MLLPSSPSSRFGIQYWGYLVVAVMSWRLFPLQGYPRLRLAIHYYRACPFIASAFVITPQTTTARRDPPTWILHPRAFVGTGNSNNRAGSQRAGMSESPYRPLEMLRHRFRPGDSYTWVYRRNNNNNNNNNNNMDGIFAGNDTRSHRWIIHISALKWLPNLNFRSRFKHITA
jgi:hypothetical protein